MECVKGDTGGAFGPDCAVRHLHSNLHAMSAQPLEHKGRVPLRSSILRPSDTERRRIERRKHMSLFARDMANADPIWHMYDRIVGFDTMPDAQDTVSGNASYTLQVR